MNQETGETIWPDRENRNSNVIGGPHQFDFNLIVRESKAGEIREMFASIVGEM